MTTRRAAGIIVVRHHHQKPEPPDVGICAILMAELDREIRERNNQGKAIWSYGYALNAEISIPAATSIELFAGSTPVGISFTGIPDPTFTGGKGPRGQNKLQEDIRRGAWQGSYNIHKIRLNSCHVSGLVSWN
jgi:hypothetical protein